MHTRNAWIKQGLMVALLLTLVIGLLFVQPWTRARAAGVGGIPLNPVKIEHTAHGDFRMYDRAAALALPGVVKRTVRIHSLFFKKTPRVTPYALSHQDPSGYYDLWVGAALDLLYWEGIFLCGFGEGDASTDPWWSWVTEAGMLGVDGWVIDGTFSSFVASTQQFTWCWGGTPPGTQWTMDVIGYATWFDGTFLGGTDYQALTQ